MSYQKGQVADNQFESLDIEEYYSWLNTHVDIDRHPERLTTFFLSTKDSYSQCIGLEYLLMHGYHDELRQLIGKNKQSRDKLNREWAKFYQLIIENQQKMISHDKFLSKLHKKETTDPHLECIKLFMIISVHFNLKEFGTLANILDELTIKVKSVKHPILEPLLNQRLELVLFNYYWIRNEMILARKHGFEALDLTTNQYHLANLHVNLSLSYIFDDFASAKYHNQEALNIAKENNYQRLIKMIEENNTPFLYAHFNQPDGITTPVKSEQAHLAIARGDLEEARQLLSEVTESTPFIKYYLGLAHQDRHLLIQSYNQFIESRSDHFFARLPLTALQNM